MAAIIHQFSQLIISKPEEKEDASEMVMDIDDIPAPLRTFVWPNTCLVVTDLKLQAILVRLLSDKAGYVMHNEGYTIVGAPHPICTYPVLIVTGALAVQKCLPHCQEMVEGRKFGDLARDYAPLFFAHSRPYSCLLYKSALEDSKNGTNECVICLATTATVCFWPCGHLIVCSTCTAAVGTSCPLCRSPIEQTYSLFGKSAQESSKA